MVVGVVGDVEGVRLGFCDVGFCDVGAGET